MAIVLDDAQKEALKQMKNGCILCSGVGSGKSRTALSYYYISQKLDIRHPGASTKHSVCDLYIITTAAKRNKREWDEEMVPFMLSCNAEENTYNNKVVVDSWNNIAKYKEVDNSFFIFDEQRATGKGPWAKAFIEISKHNQWIMLSATPGDNWMDYVPVFIANGFFKNRTQFNREHVIFSPYTKWAQVDGYLYEAKLYRLRNSILVDMDVRRETIPHNVSILCEYDAVLYKTLMKTRWSILHDEPIEKPPQLCYELRYIVNSNESRGQEVVRIVKRHKKVIIFYNFDYELEILRALDYGDNVRLGEWNGHNHDAVPGGDKWVYLVNYTAGAEGWNCTKTDTIIFYSQNYSYKTIEQAKGRIDRRNTPFHDLYYYHLKSNSKIDMAIGRALKEKRKFNEMRFVSQNKHHV